MLALTNAVHVLAAGALGQRATTTTTTAPTDLFPRTSGWVIAIVSGVLVIVMIAWGRFKLEERRARRRVMNWGEEERISRQWKFLQQLYDLTGGQPRYRVKTTKMMKQLGWDAEATYAVRDKLVDGNMLRISWKSPRKVLESWDFIKKSDSDPKDDEFSTEWMHITQLGAEQVRSMRGSPGAARELDRRVVQISIGDITDSQVHLGQGHQIMQKGSMNWANITDALTAFERALAGPGLTETTAGSARAYLRAARDELASPNPDREMLKSLLGRMRDIAISAAGSGLWAAAVLAFEKVFR